MEVTDKDCECEAVRKAANGDEKDYSSLISGNLGHTGG